MEETDPQTYAVIGAAMEVHRRLGRGFLEAVYQQALAVEFDYQKIPFRRECPIEIEYRGTKLDVTYRADFVCFDDVIVEIKAVAALSSNDQAQILNYLKATGMRRGLLLNFSQASLETRRFVLD